MGGYLDAYGVADQRRERRLKRIVIWGLAAVILATSCYFLFRNWRQERTVKQFFSLLDQKNYQAAYALWGCTQDTPCKYYSPEKFNEDFGPSSPFANAGAAKILHTDVCGTGVVFDVEIPRGEEVGLYVDRETNVIGFAPGPRCPGPHFQLWEFIKSRFS
jgi:hypothetical protein